MDAPSSDSQDSLFFHLQRNPVRQYRRVRKEPEELPQALRYFKYANLNPRIAAFLGKQDPKSLLKRSKTGGGKQDGKDGPNVAPNGGIMGGEFGNDLSQEARRLLPEIGQGMRMGAFGEDGFGQSRLSFNNEIDDPQRYQFEETTFAAPNILRELADILAKFKLTFNEYVHRTTLYDPDTGDPMPTESTNPSILLPAGVTNLLSQSWDEVVSETIYTNRVWQTTAYKAAYNTTATSGKLDPSQIPTENVTVTAPPPHTDKAGTVGLKPELKSIVDLLDETRAKAYSKREERTESRTSADKKKSRGLPRDSILQSLAVPSLNRKQHSHQIQKWTEEQKELNLYMPSQTQVTILSAKVRNEEDRRKSVGFVSTVTNSKSVSGKGRKEKSASSRKLMKEKSKIKTGDDKNAKTEDGLKKSSKPTLQLSGGSSKQSKTGIRSGQSGTRKASKLNVVGGNLLSIPEEKRRRSIGGLGKGKDWSMRSNVSMQEGGSPERLQRNQTLSFNLTSKKAMDEGWIVKIKPDPDMEQNNVLEWATNRLQSAIKQKEDEDEQAKKSGNIKPVVIRYYGDSRRDTLLKLYRKGNENDGKAAAVAAGLLPGRKSAGAVLKIPQLKNMESTEKERFMVQVPDGSITVYYPHNGNVAVMASAVPNNPGQLYVNCYANDESRTCLATFTPYGKSCCYHKNGSPGLVLSDDGGYLKTEDGSVQKKWDWPREGLKLKEHVVFNLNKEMYVRVLNRSNVTLNYTASRESVKIPVGAIPGVACPAGPVEQASVLRSGLRFSSKAASEYQPGLRSAKDEKNRASRLRKYGIRKYNTQSRRTTEIDELKRSLDPPERFEFESQADRELQRLQNKSKWLVEEWMEHYRSAVGISSPALKKLLDAPVKPKTPHRKVQSARERKVTEEDDEFLDHGTKFQSFRSPSAPPKHMLPGPHSIEIVDDRLKRHLPSALAGSSSKKAVDTHVRIDETPADVKSTGRDQATLRTPSTAASRQRPHTHGSRSTHRPQRSSLRTSSSASSSAAKSPEKHWRPAPECCPAVARNNILHGAENPDKVFTCKCSKHRIPVIHDLELDYFLRMVAPAAQLIVICVVNSLYPEASPYDTMFDKLYIDRNKNRSKPCSQSRHDQYRILRYDLAVAKIGSHRPSPLLLGRHNVVPGMTLMYCGGRLLFADHIFNGYGNARNDFRKQVFRTKKEFLLGHFLPDDFRFTPGIGKPGFRAAWGGEMGGAGVGGRGAPGMFFTSHTLKAKSAGFQPNVAPPVDETRSEGDVTSDTTIDLKMQTSKSFDTARDFVQYTLSTRMYVVPPHHKRSNTRLIDRSRSTATSRFPLNATYPPVGATPHSAVNDDGSLRVGPLNSFVRMQAVK